MLLRTLLPQLIGSVLLSSAVLLSLAAAVRWL